MPDPELPKGYITLEFSFDTSVRVEDCVKGWSKEEIAELLAGDKDARDALIGEAEYLSGNHAECDHATIEIDGKELPEEVTQSA